VEEGGRVSKLTKGKLKLERIAAEERSIDMRSMNSATIIEEWLKRKRRMKEVKEENEEEENYMMNKEKKIVKRHTKEK
jgi:predicted NUDIX family NTP pyrophosphohydrolase